MPATPPPLDPDTHALFLDFDGTLVEFRDDPAAVCLDASVVARLSVLQQALSGALAIVSGRRIADLDRFLEPLGFAAAGVHGLERRGEPGGSTVRLAGPGTLDDLRAALARRLGETADLDLEDKGTALVLHYRRAPAAADAAKAMMAEAVGGRTDLVVMHGKDIVEVHAAGVDKGTAVADFLKMAPFRGRVPVYVGDDTTDEFAFQALRPLGGVTIKVGAAKVGPPPSAAEFSLADVAAVHRWLQAPR